MAATLSGKIAVYGIDATIAFSGMLKTVAIVKGFGWTQSGREARLTKNGHVIGAAKDEMVRSISVTFVPYDSDSTPSLAGACDVLQAAIPPDLGDVVIADSDVTIFDGTWTAVGQVGITPREDGYAEVSVTCEQYKQSGGSYSALSAVASA
jgi:hypothetical protein